MVLLKKGTWISRHSVRFSRSVVSDSLRPRELQQARPPCPSPTPGVYSNPCPSSRWCHPPISSSVVPFSSCPQSLPASGSFPMSQLFASVAKVLGLINWSRGTIPAWACVTIGNCRGISELFQTCFPLQVSWWAHLLPGRWHGLGVFYPVAITL